MKGLVAWALCGVPAMKAAQVQTVYGVADEVSQMALGQPVLQRFGQELLFVTASRKLTI